MSRQSVVVDEWAVPTTDRDEQRFRLVDFGEEFGLEFLDGTWEPVKLVCVSGRDDGGPAYLVALRAAVFSAICARIAQQAAKAQVVQ